MTTPAADAPFDPHAFPADLLAAQLRLTELYAALHAHQAALPWSREPSEGWAAEEERGRQRSGRPETEGWAPDAAAKFDSLLKDLREAAATVQCHPHWKACQANGVVGPELVAARQALKHAPGAAAPLGQDDVRTAA
ncbi:hypothetical protein AB0H51_28025 [Streptomyces griseoluteus]|uniref:hypothetical protein n=1 Tax=Streptomyces griseoluteus TaxID=29306 RepID=UPI0033D8366C